MMDENEPKYFDDEGTEINPNLVPKPDLCITCKKDSLSGEEEILCNLTRADQMGEGGCIRLTRYFCITFWENKAQ
ncbi:hypothetical protein ACFL3Q_05160 [Planctomycetota bacterium]